MSIHSASGRGIGGSTSASSHGNILMNKIEMEVMGRFAQFSEMNDKKMNENNANITNVVSQKLCDLQAEIGLSIANSEARTERMLERFADKFAGQLSEIAALQKGPPPAAQQTPPVGHVTTFRSGSSLSSVTVSSSADSSAENDDFDVYCLPFCEQTDGKFQSDEHCDSFYEQLAEKEKEFVRRINEANEYRVSDGNYLQLKELRLSTLG